MCGSPGSSPDGSILIAVQAEGNHSRLVKVDRGSGQLTVLYARADSTVCTPAFSPDGTRVAFVVQAGGRDDIMLLALPLNGTAVVTGQPIEDVNVDAAIPLLVHGPGREYYPCFIDDDTVAFSSDWSSHLALYAANPGSTPTLLCDDPVGAWAGEKVNGDIVYASWRSSGFTLFQKEEVAEPSPAVEERPPSALPALPAMPAARAYFDLPRFLYWAPIPIYLTSVGTSGLLFAPGVLFGALSNLESSSLAGSFSFRTDWLQPAVQIDFETRMGRTRVSYQLAEGFSTTGAGDSAETLQQELGFSIPLVDEVAFRTTTQFVASTGVTDSILVGSPQPFTFLDGFRGVGADGAVLGIAHDFGLTAGLSYSRSISGSDTDLFPSALVVSGSSVVYPVSATGMGAVAQGLASLAFPSPLPHQVIKIGMKTSYTTFTEPFIQVTNPRGDFDPVTQSLPGRALLSLDYQFPIALLDAPLVYSLGLVAFGGGVHVEAAADWSPAPGTLAFDRDIYMGAEVLFVVSLGESTVPVLIGASLRFDPRFATPFDWATDIRPYIAFSTDSFAGVDLVNHVTSAPAYRPRTVRARNHRRANTSRRDRASLRHIGRLSL